MEAGVLTSAAPTSSGRWSSAAPTRCSIALGHADELERLGLAGASESENALVSRLDGECEWLVASGVLPADLVIRYGSPEGFPEVAMLRSHMPGLRSR